MKKIRRNSTSIFLIIVAIGIFQLFNNCSQSTQSTSDAGAEMSTEPISADVLKTESYTFINKTYEMRMIKINGPNGPIYVQYVPACTTPCPLVIFSQPYSGIDWSGEPGDLKWAQRPNSEVGYFYKDEDGPLYSPSSVGELFYQRMPPAKVVTNGSIFLPNNISIAFVFSRFYRGQDLDRYVQDHMLASRLLSLQKEVDPQNVGYFGLSLGGFISAHSYVSGDVAVKAVALLSPLLDLENQWNFVESTLPKVVSTNSNLLLDYQKFFDPYIRRIRAFTGGSPSESPAGFAKYSVANLAAKWKVPSLVLHDTWDTLVPFEQSLNLKNGNPQHIEEIWYQHATDINWNSFVKDHAQPNEGLNSENTWPFYVAFLSKKLTRQDQPLSIYFSAPKFLSGLSEMRQAQLRGQNISWLRPRFVEWCDPRLTFIDVSAGPTPVLNGIEFVQSVLRNIWGVALVETEICKWISDNPLPN